MDARCARTSTRTRSACSRRRRATVMHIAFEGVPCPKHARFGAGWQRALAVLKKAGDRVMARLRKAAARRYARYATVEDPGQVVWASCIQTVED